MLTSRARGKLVRRVIASANMVLRAQVYIVEKPHRTFSVKIYASVLGVGGKDMNKEQKVIDHIKSYKRPNARAPKFFSFLP